MDPLAPHIIDVPTIEDERGNLAVLTDAGALPFRIARVEWLTGMEPGPICLAHAWYDTEVVVTALSGRVEVMTEYGGKSHSFVLDKPNRGLYLPPLAWREMYATAANAVVMVVASTLYDPADRVYDYELFSSLNRNV